MKLRGALLLCTALLMPVPAKAEPVSAFFAGLAGGTATSAAVASAIGGLTSFAYSAGVFFTTTLGSLLLSVGVNAIAAALNKPDTPTIERARVNTRLPDATRWQIGGRAVVGGELGTFAEYDEDGNFWFFVVHGDSEMVGEQTYLLDGIEVEVADTDTVEISVDRILKAQNYTLSGEVFESQAEAGSVQVTDNSRVLLRAQTDPVENGVWVTSTGAWARASDMAAGDDIDYFVVTDGVRGTYSVTDPSGVVGTDDMVWSSGENARVSGDVLTDAFCLTPAYEQFEGTGPRLPVFRVYPVSPDASQVYGARPADFAAAFPNLPSDFYLAGVSYTIVRCAAVPLEHYRKAYRWRGGLGLGEPSVSVVSNFSRMYDPRNEDHDIEDPSTWTPGDGNPAILWAWWRTTRYGRNKPMSSIAWDKVATEADKCDATVLDRSSEPVPRYRCGVAFPDNKPRHECERDILQTCDGFVVYDDEGKAWPRVGVYEAPTLTFSAARDIISEQTEIVDDGEAQIDGVIVEYISPDHGWTKQPSAPWLNPTYYDALIQPNFLTIPILGCQNHNQAVRLAKAYGLLAGAERKAALNTTIKGILAKGERTITLDLDAEFQGPHQIATPVVEAPSGTEAAFAVVPMQTDRYDLGEGEEGPPPALAPVLDIDDTLEIAGNVNVAVETISSASGASVRLVATFDAPSRVDRFFRFRYRLAGSTDPHEFMATDMDELRSLSPIVSTDVDYTVTWQTVTAGGRATVWSDERDTPASITVSAIADDTPGPLADVVATAGNGAAVFEGTGSDTGNFRGVRIYRGAVGAAFSTASIVKSLTDVESGAAFEITAGTPATNLFTNPGFDADTDWTKGTGWTISTGKANAGAATDTDILQAITGLPTTDHRFGFTMSDRVSGNVRLRIEGSPSVISDAFNADGRHAGTIEMVASVTEVGFRGVNFEGSIDDAVLFEDGPDYLTQGAADYWIVPVSFSGAEGEPDGPHTLTII